MIPILIDGADLKIRRKDAKKYYCFFIVVTVSIFSLYSVALSKSPKAPTLTIIEPSSNSVVMGAVNIVASATIGIVKMEFFIDGILLKIDYEPGLDGEWSTTWGTTRYVDGYHDIVAQATDNRGKTAVNHISVIVNNLPNIPPVAALDYSWDGNKYYFYPYECYDPNGYIVKFQYTISKLDNSGYEDSYAWCMYSYCNFSNDPVIADICRGGEAPEPECLPPGQDSRFGLFYTCPYIYYEFGQKDAEYKVGLRVWDNEGEASNIAEGTIRIVTSGNSNDMYVWGINPRIKPTGSGSTLILIVTVRNDSNENGQSDSNDFPLPGVLVKIELSKDADVIPDGDFDLLDSSFNISIEPAITNRDGQAVFVMRGLQLGDYRATVSNLTLLDHDYNPALDIVNPLDVSIW